MRSNLASIGQEKGGELSLFVGVSMLALLVFAAFFPALNAGFIWDDDTNVTANGLLLTLDGLRRIWFDIGSFRQYYPLSLTFFWVQHKLWGFDPLGYHFMNMAGHALASLLVWRCLRLLRAPGAFLAAALFAVHPVMIEAVAWVTECTAILSGIFYLAAFYCMIKSFGLDQDDAAPLDKKQYVLGMVLFLCALTAKTSTVTFPAALLLVIWWKRGRVTLRHVLLTAPFFGCSLAFGLLAVSLEISMGTEGFPWALSEAQRLIIVGRAWWFYIGKVLAPVGIIMTYPRWEIDPRDWVQYGYPFAALAVMLTLFLLRGKIGRGPLTAVLFYTGTMFPFLGVVNGYFMRYSYVWHHLHYLAIIGVFALFSGVLAMIYRRYARKLCAPAVLVAFLLLPLALITWDRTLPYTSTFSLYTDILEHNPASFVAHTNLAAIFIERGEFAAAEQHLRTSMELSPYNMETMNLLAEALGGQGRFQEAETQLRKALRLMPRSARTWNNLAVVLVHLGREREAREALQTSLELEPGFYDAQSNLDYLDKKTRKE